MRRLVLALLIVSAAPAALADSRDREGRDRDVATRPPIVDCGGAGVTHARRAESSRPQRLAELPEAWKLHAVQRKVNGCQVHPEARKASDLEPRRHRAPRR
jgi:hypothetical protein